MTVYPCCRNARSARFPNFRRSLDAPMTATTLGMKNEYSSPPQKDTEDTGLKTVPSAPPCPLCPPRWRVLSSACGDLRQLVCFHELEQPRAAFLEVLHRRGVGDADETGRIERLARRHRDARLGQQRIGEIQRRPE